MCQSQNALCGTHSTTYRFMLSSPRFGNDDNDDNNNILFDDNLQIEITISNSLENRIINCFGDDLTLLESLQ